MAGNLGKTRDATPGPRPPAKKVRRKKVAGPYRSQSSVPSIRKGATKREHREAPSPPPAPPKKKARRRRDPLATPKLTAPKLQASAKQAAATSAKIRRILAPRHERKYAPLTSATEPKERSNKKVDLLPLAVEQDVIEPAKAAGVLPEHKTIGQKIYQRIAEYGPAAISMTPEIAVAAKAAQAAIRGVEVGGARVGGSAVTKALKAETPAEQAAVTTRVAEKVAAKAQGGVKGVAKRAAKKVTRAEGKADRAVVRRITGAQTRKGYAAEAGVPLKAVKAAAGQNLPVVRGHEEAILDRPGKTLGTTLKIAPGVVTAPVGMAADAGLSVGRLTSEALHTAGVPGFRSYSTDSILDPIKGQAEAQVEFFDEVRKVVLSDDPAYVKKQVENHLGLLLPAMAAPLVARAFKPTYARILEKARRTKEIARAEHGVARRPVTEEAQTVHRHTERRQHRKEEAVRAANAKHHAELETGARGAEVLKHARKAKGPKETIRTLPSQRFVHGPRSTQRVTINPGDAVGFLARLGISRDPKKAELQIEHIRDRIDRDAAAELPKLRINTLDLTDYLLRHKEVLGDPNLWHAVDAYKEQAKTLQTSETARVQPVMQAHAHSFAEPEGLSRKELRAWRAENAAARQANPGIRHFDRVPLEARPHTTAVTRSELKVEISRDRAKLKKAALKGNKKKVRELAAGIAAKRRGLYRELSPEERKAVLDDLAETDVTDPAEIRAHLKKAREAKAAHSDKALEREYLEQADELIRHYGHEEPAYSTQADVRSKGSPSVSAVGGQLPKMPGGEKQRTGRLQEIGAVEESLPGLLRESIRVPVARKHIFANTRDFIEERAVRFNGKTEITSREAGKLIDDGVFNPRDNILIPRQLYKRAFDALEHGDETEMAALKQSLTKDAQTEILKKLGNESAKGRKYVVVPREAATEFFAQTDALSSPQNFVATANRFTSRAILGTSPAWAAMQLLAEGAQAAVAVNPARMARGLKAYAKLPPEKQLAFQTWAGETPGVAIAPKDVQLGLRDGSMAQASDAFGVANKTALGRGLKNLSTAEILGMLDRRKGGIYRRAVLAGKIDRDLNAAMHKFVGGVKGMWREQDAATQHLKSLPLEKQLEWFVDNPKFMKRQQTYLDDVMGNWNALTRHERTLASAVIFYPFVRMSLRWLLWSFPKQHPIKASILYYLGQQNSNEVQKLLHGDPSFFNYAMTPLHSGEGGAPEGFIDLQRMAPGANSLVQGLGGSGEGPAGLLAARVAQPWMTAFGTAVFGVNPLSGHQEPGSGYQAAAELMSLALPVRLAQEHGLIPELPGQGPTGSRTSEAFREEGSKGLTADLRKSVVPVIPKPLDQERHKVRLAKLLEKERENPNPSAFTGQIIQAIFPDDSGRIDRKKVIALVRGRKRGEQADDAANKLEQKMSGIDYGEMSEEQSKALRLITGALHIPLEPEDEAELLAELQGTFHEGPPQIGGGEGGPAIVSKTVKRRSRGKVRRKELPAPAGPTIIGG
jgi:hypothetical protein